MKAVARLLAAGGVDTLRGRMLAWILAVAIPIYGGAVWLAYDGTARQLEGSAIRDADQLAARLASGLDALIRPVESGIHTVARQLEEVDPPRQEYDKRLRGILEAWPEIYGSTIAVEVGGASDYPYAPYLYRRDGVIHAADLARDSYAYRTLPWYRAAVDSRHAAWSPPYFDAGGGEIWMVTYSVPFYRKRPGGGRLLAGVVTADVDLDWMRRSAAEVQLGTVGVGWLSSAEGRDVFVAPIGDTPQQMQQLGGGVDARQIRAIGAAMLARNESFQLVQNAVAGRPGYVAVRNLRTLGWHLTLLIPRDALLAQAREQLSRQVTLGLVGLALLLMAVSLVAAGITRPIHELARQVGRAGEDNLHFPLPATRRRDELGVLTDALRRLRDSLQRHVQLRAESLAAQARLEQELQISAGIQQSMLPQGDASRRIPAALQIAARLLPARQVGGDLYDYFPVQHGGVMFVIGDVSDKGIPAALFMARFSAVLRVLSAGGGSPDHLLADTNQRLVEGNEACMFVTAGCGVIDPATGAYCYASAGHDAPLHGRAEGAIDLLEVRNGPALGIEEQAVYPLHEGVLAPGDMLLLYTDGLTEAEAEGGVQFGVERVIAQLVRHDGAVPAALVGRIVDDVASHAAGFHAHDDLTVLAIRFTPAEVVVRRVADGAGWLIEIEPTATGLLRVQQRVACILLARDVPPALRHDVELVVEEWLTNVLRASDGLRQLTVDVVLTSIQVALTFRDDGAPFNPLDVATPDLDATITERVIGGLGIHLVRQTASHCEYQRSGAHNVFTASFARDI